MVCKNLEEKKKKQAKERTGDSTQVDTVKALEAANTGVENAQTKSSGSTGADVGTGALGGAASGAALGSAIAPGAGTAIGAGVGAGLGATVGLLKAQQAKKQREREAQVAAVKAEGEGRLQAAATMSEMINNIRRTMGL